ncbi:MAG: rubrerythrin [Saccharolobus sp.]|jgi:rubrerythrin|uniref:rubrerythrin n=1 Tax=Saccharolobus sp. TaxID=2100761 RepID=UPI0028CE8725|nr:rubrerythrin [Saccharolobus sp.]MDT7861705.1 rubrerythrin [Saccharolobus sp.]
MVLGKETEMGLKELFRANAEDFMSLMLIAEKLEQLGKKEEAKALREKALVELGHAKAIFETLLRHQQLNNVVGSMAKEEQDQHVSEYNKVAMTAKQEGHEDIEKMLCSFAEQEAKIAETLMKVSKVLEEMAKEEEMQHISEYNKVAMTAKQEGHEDIEKMLCSFAEQEAKISETIKAVAKAL